MVKVTELLIDLNSFESRKEIDVAFDNPFAEIKCSTQIVVHAVLYKTRDSVVLTGDIQTVVIDKCARCLKDVEVPINGTLEAVYIPFNKYIKEIKDGPVDNLENTLPLKEEVLDLSDRVIEAIIVEIPQKVLCVEDCRGLCPVCGVDLNENPDHFCEGKEEPSDKWHSLLGELKKNIVDNNSDWEG
ncbi:MULTISPECIES: DUF177 domain-containing protein [Kosmotoga]|uniref:DUF177 domain-containing protein n=1 Tax=Kosmotoga olearia (strain ATCC BAA-1733 / DSM 21960 / TBF 19.5.1) TaxID=521045 RepID=C5CEP4_KOSOT|nr:MULTISPECIES: DUF177 domain-containing protein [Kosmotoga]ACR80224.1 protein of unknown function DUF177 [Kosmotoga olearia TBF 19.5.1]MDI3523491.1 hypothetical protein [Kosmotoga sp.]MDK2952966.1 hypothetical protein [Kosmotoga sp.]OAA20164.1 hypothetical protein DU53_08445 [Kosmotoga sp. DU53]